MTEQESKQESAPGKEEQKPASEKEVTPDLPEKLQGKSTQEVAKNVFRFRAKSW